jgi:hypothetical protein
MTERAGCQDLDGALTKKGVPDGYPWAFSRIQCLGNRSCGKVDSERAGLTIRRPAGMQRARSSVGLERVPDKDEVTSSNLVGPMNTKPTTNDGCGFYCFDISITATSYLLTA